MQNRYFVTHAPPLRALLSKYAELDLEVTDAAIIASRSATGGRY